MSEESTSLWGRIGFIVAFSLMGFAAGVATSPLLSQEKPLTDCEPDRYELLLQELDQNRLLAETCGACGQEYLATFVAGYSKEFLGWETH